MLGRKLAGRYSVVKPLAEGGFGETFLAEDTHLPDSPQCVVKKLKTGSHEPALLHTVRRLFDSEAKVLHQLGDHPQIPRLLAHFEDGEEFYLAEEYVEGESLADELVPGQQLDEETVIELLHDILEVLSFVHDKQVIHRDIKPSNLIRRQSDRKLVLIDFGAVKQVTTQIAESATQMPRTVLIGTSGYMPSEQFRGQPRLCSDVYAVGIIALQALTGLRPSFGELPEDENTGEIAWRDRVSVSPAFATLLEKMVLYDYRQRYRSANDALLAVQSLIAAREAEVSPPPPVDNLPETVVNLRQGAGNPVQPLPAVDNTVQQLETTAQTDNTVQQLETTAQQSTNVPNLDTSNGLPQIGDTAQQADPIPTTPQTSAANLPGAMPPETVAVSPRSPQKTNGLSRTKVLTGGLVALLMGGTALAFTSPHLQSVCTVLNNCSQDIQFKATFDEAVEDAKSAETREQQAKTIDDLQSALKEMDDAIAELKKIPKNVKVYDDAKKAIAEYQAESTAISTRIQTENKADETFKKATTIAQAVQKKAKSDDSVATLDQHKAEWAKAIKLLKDVPKDTLVASQVEAKQKDFDKQLKALNGQRQKKIAAAAEAQRKLEAAQAAQAASVPARSTPAYVPPQRSTYVAPRPAPAPVPRAAPRPAPRPAPAPAPRRQEPLWGPGSGQSNNNEPLW
ncbi:protein kinase domain-containing protein [Acaryochloris marina]|uniref:non-specific serine/threonine protein kinase n=1 Tax=Acaryochloris marina (strain MBIC 11017) TaxID=329726 RepID=B0BZF6_ACAM1|nr:protein kinase [Acaryochloris marina]ABW30701.1 serine/threonine protein kinase [Acaryochloris marina MBIC11017]